MLLLIIGLLLFVGLVIVHEWGHFIAARKCGVVVEEFAIGFPPRLFAKKLKSGLLLSVNLLPLGGFVRLKGEHDDATEPGSFGAASLPNKAKIMLAGVAMNLVTCVALLTVLSWLGLPTLLGNQFTVASDTKIVREVRGKDEVLVSEVIKDSPAALVGLKGGDRILSINGQSITQPDRVSELAKTHAGQSVQIEILREGEKLPFAVTLAGQNNGKGYLGVGIVSGAEGIELRRSTWSAPVVAVGVTGQFAQATYKGIGTALGGLLKGDTTTASEQVAGPVGIFAVLKEGTNLGVNFVLMIIAVISLTLALMNMLPIPALDGGRLFVTLLFRGLKKPLTRATEEWIHGIGFAALMLLFILVTIVDVKRIF